MVVVGSKAYTICITDVIVRTRTRGWGGWAGGGTAYGLQPYEKRAQILKEPDWQKVAVEVLIRGTYHIGNWYVGIGKTYWIG